MQKKKQIPFSKSQGQICGEFIIPYPPGIPLLAPGEVITKQIMKQIAVLQKANISLVGCHNNTLNTIEVIS